MVTSFSLHEISNFVSSLIIPDRELIIFRVYEIFMMILTFLNLAHLILKLLSKDELISECQEKNAYFCVITKVIVKV